MRHKEYLFSTVDKAIESTFDTLAMSGAIKCPGYDVPTAGSTRTDKISTGERFQQAGWILGVARRAVKPCESAWLTLTYDGPGEAREQALDCLTAHFSNAARNQPMLRAVIAREFIFGNTYCPPLVRVAKDTGAAVRAAEDCVKRIRPLLAELGKETNAAILKAFKNAGYAKHAG